MALDWVPDAIFYHVFADRFARGKPYSDVSEANLEPWDAPPTLHGYKGGNLWGVIERLDYLQDLGVNALYFTPVFQAPSNHRYNTHDYYRVDSLLGGDTAFSRLIEAVHARGMRVVLDCVFNHTGRGFFPFTDILENGEQSPWRDWYRISGWPLRPYDSAGPPNYACWNNDAGLPQLNHVNPAVREYLFEVAEHWVRAGIDGWRLDVPHCIGVDGFWEEFRERVKALNPDVYLVGEAISDGGRWLDGSTFDGVTNYAFATPTIRFAAGDCLDARYLAKPDSTAFPKLTATGYAASIADLLSRYEWRYQLQLMNLVGSHDTARVLTVAGGDHDSVKLATLLLMTYPGPPAIFYGDEVGLAGGVDPDCRRGFPPRDQWHWDLFALHKELIALRRSHIALRTGRHEVVFSRGSCYAFRRHTPDAQILVAVNAGATEESIPLASRPEGSRPILYGAPSIHPGREGLELRIPARSGAVLLLEP